MKKLLLLVAIGCCLPAGCRPAAPAYDGPARHVVVLSLDTTRADFLGLYGNERVATPNLDALAAESIVFDDLMTPVPTTLASHTSLFTGKYPQTHGVPRNGFVVHEDNVLLAELLAERGFHTAGFAGSFALESRFRIAQGFQHYDETFERLAGEQGLEQSERSAEAVTRAVLEHLNGIDTTGNLFLFVHYFDAHAPYEAPAPYDTMYDPRGREELPSWTSVRKEFRPGARNELSDRVVAQYAGEISYMDHHIGVLLDGLRERGILDEALVIVTSDHGENHWEHPAAFDHGWTTYQTTLHSVGIVRLPGGRNGGARISRLVSTVDLLPSILSFLQIPAPAGIDGEAIDLETDNSRSDPVRFGQATKPWKAVETDPRWTNMLKARCVRQGRYKLIQVPYAGEEELYDLEVDPLEQTNLLEQPSPEIEAVARGLRQQLESWAASAQPLPSHFDSSQRDETIERLKGLGYLGG